MDKERLEQLRSLQMEIKLRSNEIKYLRSQNQNGEPVADTVKDYSTGYGRVIVIRGYSDEKIQQKINILEKRTAKLEKELEELEDWIESIDDSETRMIFTMRYKDGASWDEISARLYSGRNTVKRKHDNFLAEK